MDLAQLIFQITREKNLPVGSENVLENLIVKAQQSLKPVEFKSLMLVLDNGEQANHLLSSQNLDPGDIPGWASPPPV